MSNELAQAGGKGLAGKIARWLRPLAFPFDLAKTKPAVSLWAKHVNVNEKTAEVRLFDLADLSEGRFATVVADVAETLVADAGGYDAAGPQRYLLLAQDADGVQIARLAVRAKGEDPDLDAAEQGVGSEPATNKGVLAQLMRHNEGIMRLALMNQAEASAQMARMNERLMVQVADAQENRLEMYQLMEELMSGRDERANAAKEVTAKIEGRKAIAKMALPLLGAIAAKVAGHAVPGVAETAGDAAMRAIVQSITPDQIEQLEGVLTPTQKINLLALMERYAPEDGEPDGAG